MRRYCAKCYILLMLNKIYMALFQLCDDFLPSNYIFALRNFRELYYLYYFMKNINTSHLRFYFKKPSGEDLDFLNYFFLQQSQIVYWQK